MKKELYESRKKLKIAKEELEEKLELVVEREVMKFFNKTGIKINDILIHQVSYYFMTRENEHMAFNVETEEDKRLVSRIGIKLSVKIEDLLKRIPGRNRPIVKKED